MKHHTLFFRKLGKVSKNLLSAAVVIGALRVKSSIFIVSVWHRNGVQVVTHFFHQKTWE